MKKLLSSVLMLSLSMAVIAFPSRNQDPPPQDPAKSQSASPALTNKDVLDMMKAGLTADIIVAKIKSSESSFDTTPAALADLKAANVPDAVILAMVKGPAGAGAASEAAPVDGIVNVPDGTEIEIQLTNNASGEELKVGDTVDFVVVGPIQMNGLTIFEKGAGARARITTAKRAGHWGKAGKLEWAMQDVMAADGNRIPARFTQRQIGDSKGGTVAVAAVATTVFLGPVGLLWGLKKGKPAIIPGGNRYSVFVHGDTKIKGKPVEAASKEQ
ncbi:MAG TPA: hypothetical protein VHH35_02090 [Pyrinomonadaceae bacterium]|nr:hypothetical protein [Pyrinomonadaceae bacterium]